MLHRSYKESTRFTSLGSLGRFFTDVFSSKHLDFTALAQKQLRCFSRVNQHHPFQRTMYIYNFHQKFPAIHVTTLKSGTFLAVLFVNWFWKDGVELDPCSNKDSIVYAKKEIMLPDDGLDEDWSGYTTVFVNPPYGRDVERKTTIADWIKKCHDTSSEHCGTEIIALIPVATNTSHWKNHVFGSASAICFLSDMRLKFRVNNNENNKGCPMACCLVYWGNKSNDFCDTFSPLGYCLRTK